MTKKVTIAVAALLVALSVHAQTPGGGVAHWTQLELPATASSFVYTLSNTAVPSSVTTPVVLTATCVLANNQSACTAPVAAALMVKGAFTLCASDGFTTACSVPFTPGTVSNPGAFFVSRS
jgi:hypothetical protein